MQMRFAPRITPQGDADSVLRLGLDDVHNPVAGRQWAAQNKVRALRTRAPSLRLEIAQARPRFLWPS
jgi:hypothetical protein